LSKIDREFRFMGRPAAAAAVADGRQLMDTATAGEWDNNMDTSQAPTKSTSSSGREDRVAYIDLSVKPSEEESEEEEMMETSDSDYLSMIKGGVQRDSRLSSWKDEEANSPINPATDQKLHQFQPAAMTSSQENVLHTGSQILGSRGSDVMSIDKLQLTSHSSLVHTNCNMSVSETRSTVEDEMSPPLSPKRSLRWTLQLQNEVLIRNKFSSSLKFRLDHLDISPFPKMNKVVATRSSWMIF
jgi:hypothetical protein